MKDCFYLSFKNITYLTADGSRALVEEEKSKNLYLIDVVQETLENWYAKDYGYYVKMRAKRCKNCFVCEAEIPPFYV